MVLVFPHLRRLSCLINTPTFKNNTYLSTTIHQIPLTDQVKQFAQLLRQKYGAKPADCIHKSASFQAQGIALTYTKGGLDSNLSSKKISLANILMNEVCCEIRELVQFHPEICAQSVATHAQDVYSQALSLFISVLGVIATCIVVLVSLVSSLQQLLK